MKGRRVVLLLLFVLGARTPGSGQSVIYTSGQNIAPAFEGWEQNPDGTFDMIFGYLNRNLDEFLYVPVGPNNNVEPGGPDQGQPTYFLPARNRYVFRVKVPKDFGKKELVWTITAHGKTERTYGTLKPEFVTDDIMMQGDFGGDRRHDTKNKKPVVSLEGPTARTVKVAEPLALMAHAADDGIPKPTPAPMRYPQQGNAQGLRVAWLVFRGAGSAVKFSPEQFQVYPDYRRKANSPWRPGWTPPPLPADGKFPVTVTFSQPGTYVLRVMASDGGLSATEDVTLTVVESEK